MNVLGEERANPQCSNPKQKKLPLPGTYTSIAPVAFHTKEPVVPEVAALPSVSCDTISAALQDDERWVLLSCSL